MPAFSRAAVSAETTRARWERRYAERDDPEALEPAAVVARHLHRAHVGQALDLAMGVGHNTVYCAQRGFAMVGVDISLRAVRAAKALARCHGVTIGGMVADLEAWPLPREAFDLVMNLRYLQRSLFEPIKAALRSGGLLLFETFTVDQIGLEGVHQLRRDFLLERNELLRSFSDLHIVEYTEDIAREGAVASLVARKV